MRDSALPWILILAMVLATLGLLAFLGYDNWYSFEDIVK
jgi:hypothetical protein